MQNHWLCCQYQNGTLILSNAGLFHEVCPLTVIVLMFVFLRHKVEFHFVFKLRYYDTCSGGTGITTYPQRGGIRNISRDENFDQQYNKLRTYIHTYHSRFIP
jgi:hypothetical protein